MPDLAPVNEPHPKTLTAPVTQAVLTAAALSQLTARLSGKRVLILAGPAESKDELAGVLALAHKGRWPILADPLSQLRQTDDDLLITGSDILFDGAITLGDAQPDVVLRFGATPVSATVIQWLQTFTGQVILVDPISAGRPQFIDADSTDGDTGNPVSGVAPASTAGPGAVLSNLAGT